ncbi:MAG: hypothetical protein QM796_19405 [Chthoniobacteraceae bacterium]
MPRTLRALVPYATPVLIALVVAAGGWWWQTAQRAKENTAFLQQKAALEASENKRLARLAATHPDTDDAARRRQIEQRTAETRELSFKSPVVYAVVTREGIHQVLEQKLHNVYADADFQRSGTSLAAFGLLPPNYPLEEKYLALLSEQVAAFYDQHERKLYLFKDTSLANAKNRMILSHELTHALQDQNFHLLNLPLKVRHNDDLQLATSALIEGDATVEMSQFMAGQTTVGDVLQTLSGAFTQDMSQIETAPRYLREELLAPYVKGQQFVLCLWAEGGWSAVSNAYQNPPKSTAQILHPERYLADPQWQPTKVEWPDLTFNGQPPYDDNVMGELGTRILLSEYTDDLAGSQAAEGWQGDRYLVFSGGKSLVWKTVWETPEQATLFADTLKKAWTKRFTPPADAFEIRQSGATVFLTQAPDQKTADALAAKFVN